MDVRPDGRSQGTPEQTQSLTRNDPAMDLFGPSLENRKMPEASAKGASTHAAYFRTPLFPFDSLAEFAKSVSSARLGDLSGVAKLIDSARIASALHSSNPAFACRLEAEISSGRLGEKNANSLLRYLSRMSSRCTPLGLFAGVFPAQLKSGAATRIELDSADTWTVFPRLSYERVYALIRSAFRDQVARDGDVPVHANPNMERRGNRLKVTTCQPLQEKFKPAVYDVVVDPPLQMVLSACETTQTIDNLCTLLAANFDGISSDDAKAYLLDLLDCAVLSDHYFPSLDPRIPISASVLSHCGNSPYLMRISGAMSEICTPLSLIDCSPARLRCLASLAFPASSMSTIDNSPDNTNGGSDLLALQLDLLARPKTNVLGTELVAHIDDVVRMLADTVEQTHDSLKALKEEYRRKFGEESVPLLRAVSADDGLSINRRVGNRPAYLATLPLRRERDKKPSKWSTIDTMMMEKLSAAEKSGNGEIVIEPAEIRGCAIAPNKVRASFSGWTLGTLFERSGQTAESKPAHLFLLHGIGPSGAGSIAARFAHMDPGIHAAFVDSCGIESETDAIVADVLYLVDSRMGNVSCRPPAYRYQIPIFGFATDPGCATIALSDLYLSLDRQDRFVLRSARHGKEVIPRIASAHNYRHPDCTPVYQFLGMLQEQDARALRTDLLWFARKNHCVPSVRVASVLLSPRSWFFGTAFLKALKSSRSAVENLSSALAARGVARYVRFGKDDHFVTCDTGVDQFLRLMLEEDELLLYEAVPEGYGPAAKSDDGDRQLEVAILRPGRPSIGHETSFAIATPHLPGASDWVYVKLYGGNQAIESWLPALTDLVETWMQGGDITAWHFVRYQDPDRHLRIRYRKTSAAGHDFVQMTLSAIAGCLQPGRACVDTYFPEISRYGGDAVIDTIYAVFSVDSLHVARMVRSTALATAERRVQFSVLSSNALARGLGLTPAETGRLWAGLAERYIATFAGDDRSALKRQLGALWRNWRNDIMTARQELAGLLAQYQTAIEAIAPRLREQALPGNTTCSLTDIAASVIHMHMNRLFVDSPNENEMTSYALSYHYTRSGRPSSPPIESAARPNSTTTD
jgi:thiopeptide-type bacteriocin biosynthesis protein